MSRGPRPSLPIDDVLAQVIEAVEHHPAVVVHAPTGAGKTTRLPAALLDAGVGPGGQVWCLEPRRIAARAAARHVAHQRSTRPGAEVGWHVRFDPRFCADTRLLYLTDGTAVRRIQQDLMLDGVGIVVFDEFHERSLPTDLALAMIRRVQTELRPELRLVVMSATLDATAVAAFLDDAPIVRSEGRAHPVDVRYIDRPDERSIPERTASGVRALLDELSGDLLAFLPGVGEIHRTTTLLRDRDDVDILPLYGQLSPKAQDAALRIGPRRRVVLATNVAETSLTLDGIVGVVDSGDARILRNDPGSGLDRLSLEPISQASADQRAGRAGRQEPGVALRLWTARSHPSRPAHDTPALRRTDLAGPLLQLRAWGEPDPATFAWVEPPLPDAIDTATTLLQRLKLVDERGLTALGSAAAALPLHPRLAVLALTAAQHGQGAAGALAAAILAERDPFDRRSLDDPRHHSDSDLVDRCEAIRTSDPRVDPGRRQQILKVAARIQSRLSTDALPHRTHTSAPVAIQRATALAWSDRLVLRRQDDPLRGRMVGGRGVVLHRTSAVRQGRLFVAIQLDNSDSREARVSIASAVERDWFNEVEQVDVHWDPARRQVVARRRVCIEDLILDSQAAALPDDGRVLDCLVEAVSKDVELLPLSDPEVEGLLSRMHHVHSAFPDKGVPDPTLEWLKQSLPAVLHGLRGLTRLSSAALRNRLWEHLSYPQRQTLDALAPEHYVVPSGSRKRLVWTRGAPPVLAVRMQEVFGLTQTPRVLGGRVPVLLHLLAPNGRPAQITHDLESFWQNTWTEVRSELRRRYPKHSWPEDGRDAVPERRPKRRR